MIWTTHVTPVCFWYWQYHNDAFLLAVTDAVVQLLFSGFLLWMGSSMLSFGDSTVSWDPLQD